MEDRDSDIFANTYRKKPIVVEHGSGSFLFSKDGEKYLDFLSGISINNLGYSNPEIRARIMVQLEKVIHPSNYYYTDAQIDLARKLLVMSTLDKVFFASSGTEANEAGLSFISKYRKVRPERNEMLVFENSFFGRTYGSKIAATGGNYRDLKFKVIPFNDASAFSNAVSESTLGVCLELVLGHGGIRKMNSTVIDRIKAICAEKELIIMIDEVQTGLGRAGETFLFQEFGLQPDLVTLGKSLGGGLPLSALLISNRVAETVQPGDYGCTMGGNSLACAAGAVVLDFLSDKENLEEIRKKGVYLLNGLQNLALQYPQKIKEARCYGLMGALEMREGYATDIASLSMKSGLLIDTVNQNTLRMLPAFTVSYNEIDIALDTIKDAIETLP